MRLIYLTTLLFLVFFLFQCTPKDNNQGANEEIQKLQDRLNKNIEINKELNAHLEDLVLKEQFINEIEDTIKALVSQENILKGQLFETLTSGRPRTKQYEAILKDINFLRETILTLRNQIEEKNDDDGLGSFENRVKNLLNTIDEKDSTIAVLDLKIRDNTITIKDLKSVNADLIFKYDQSVNDLLSKDGNAKEQYRKLQEAYRKLAAKDNIIEECALAYYVTGPIKELRSLFKQFPVKAEKAVLKKDFLKRMSDKNQINYYRNTAIFCNKKIIRILPERDTKSYSLDGKLLTITDPETFWSLAERALIILTEDEE